MSQTLTKPIMLNETGEALVTAINANTAAINSAAISPDLSNYVQKDGDKVLSSNDYTDAEKTKLANINMPTIDTESLTDNKDHIPSSWASMSYSNTAADRVNTTLTNHKDNSTIHITAAERTKWNKNTTDITELNKNLTSQGLVNLSDGNWKQGAYNTGTKAYDSSMTKFVTTTNPIVCSAGDKLVAKYEENIKYIIAWYGKDGVATITSYDTVTSKDSIEFTVPSGCDRVWISVGSDASSYTITPTTAKKIEVHEDKGLYGEVTELNMSLADYGLVNIIDGKLIQGSLDSSGNITVDSTRLVTNDLIPIAKGGVLRVEGNSNFKWLVCEYNSSKAKTIGTSWLTMGSTYTITTDGYYRLIIAKQNDSTIQVSDIDCRLYQDNAIDEIKNDLTELVHHKSDTVIKNMFMKYTDNTWKLCLNADIDGSPYHIMFNADGLDSGYIE